MTTQIERARVTSGLGLGIVMAVVDVVFVVGVLVPHFTATDPLASMWLGLTALICVFTLPLIAYGAALASGRRLVRDGKTWSRAARQLDVAVIALALVGFLAYVSPWGLAAVRGFMIALD